MSKFGLATVATLAACLAACTPINATRTVTVTVDGVRYSSPDAAIEAQQETSDAAIAGLPVESDPLLGKVLIVLPDRDRMRPYAIVLAHGLNNPVATEYLIDVNRMYQRKAADAMMKNHTFQGATISVRNDTTSPDMGDANFMVWFQIYSLNNGRLWGGRWLVRRAGNTATQTAIFDAGTKVHSTAWYDSFVKNVRQAALRLGGKTAAGAKPSGSFAGGGAIGSGSGFVVDTEGHIVTNNHVVASCPSIGVFDGVHERAATVIARDPSNDLALLQVANHEPSAAVFRDSGNLRAGENVVVTGFPLAGIVSSDMSVTTGSLTALKGPRDDTRILQVSAPIQPGNSGGPALDDAGDVIGIVSSTLNALALAAATGGALPQDVNFAIKASLIEEFLDSNNVHYARTATHHSMSNADIADKARKFTVRVECH